MYTSKQVFQRGVKHELECCYSKAFSYESMGKLSEDLEIYDRCIHFSKVQNIEYKKAA